MSELILVRHGQSIWNLQNRFTGWYDVDLSDNGLSEAKKAGELLVKKNIRIDFAYTSYLTCSRSSICSFCHTEEKVGSINEVRS